MFDAADKMAAQYEAGYRPPGYRAENGPPSGGDRTESRQESRESELPGLRERAAADRTELADLARDDQRSDGHADDGPREVHDAERGSDQDGTDDAAPPADRTPDDDPKEPGGADGNRGGDGPNNPLPPDGPDDGRDSPDELAAAKARIAELEKQLDAAKAENQEKDATIGRLQNTCTYLDRGREAAETKAAEQSARVDALTVTVGELTSEIDAQREAADARAAAQEARIGQLTGTVDEQNTQIGALTGEVAELRTMFGDALQQLRNPEQAKPDAPDQSDAPVAGDDLAGVNRAEGRLLGGKEQDDRAKLATTLRQEFRAAMVDTAVAGSAVVPAVMAVDSKTPVYIAGIAAAAFAAGTAATRTVRRWIGAYGADRSEG